MHRFPTLQERDELYEDFQPLVRRLIAQYGDEPELRQELRGEIYRRFCRLVEAFDPDRGVPLKAYLVRTLSASVYSYVLNRWRQRNREHPVAEYGMQSTEGFEPSGTTRTTLPVHHSEDPSHRWDDEMPMREVLKALPDAIARLPLRQRKVVIWRYYEARSFEEIAQALEVEPSTARSLLHHGVQALRRWIKEINVY